MRGRRTYAAARASSAWAATTATAGPPAPESFSSMRFVPCRVKLKCTRSDANLPLLARRSGGRDRPPVRRVPALVPQVPAPRLPGLDRVVGVLPHRPAALGDDAR